MDVNMAEEFVLPSSSITPEQNPFYGAGSSPYKSPTKRIADRLNDPNQPPESPDTKFARDRLCDALTLIKKGDVLPLSAEKTPVVEEEKRAGPGRPRRGHAHSKQKPGEVIFEMRGKPFSLREDRTSCTEYQLCRAWMRGNLKEEENWTPARVESPPDDSIPVQMLAARDVVSLPRATSPYAVDTLWPDRGSLDTFDVTVDCTNPDDLRDEYQRHWKSVKKSFVQHSRLRASRYHKSDLLLSMIHNING